MLDLNHLNLITSVNGVNACGYVSTVLHPRWMMTSYCANRRVSVLGKTDAAAAVRCYEYIMAGTIFSNISKRLWCVDEKYAREHIKLVEKRQKEIKNSNTVRPRRAKPARRGSFNGYIIEES